MIRAIGAILAAPRIPNLMGFILDSEAEGLKAYSELLDEIGID